MAAGHYTVLCRIDTKYTTVLVFGIIKGFKSFLNSSGALWHVRNKIHQAAATTDNTPVLCDCNCIYNYKERCSAALFLCKRGPARTNGLRFLTFAT